jgi:RNA polymerase sigma-70 factor (ECF subfamily)
MDAMMDTPPEPGPTAGTNDEPETECTATEHAPTFQQLYERHWDDVRDFVAGLLGNHHDAEDVAQETFILVHQRLDTYDPSRPARPWLMRIAGNQAVNFLEKQNAKKRRAEDGQIVNLTCSSRTGDFIVDVPDYREATPEDEVAQRETIGQLRGLVAGLPERDRNMIRALHFEQMSQRETAVALVMPRETVRDRNHRVLEGLRKVLECGPAA